MTGPPATSRPRVLVIEDDASVRLLLDTALSAEGYAVATAPDGAAGLDCARAHRPDLILLDLVAAGPNGRELDWSGVLSSLPADQQLRDVPVIVITGRMEEIPRLRTLLGADAVVAKPFGIQDLLHRIAAATGGVPTAESR